MAKTAVDVKQDVLTKVIADLEASQTFPNLNTLWNEAAKKYNETPGVPAPITFSVVYQRVKSWNIPIKTQSAKRRGGTTTSTDGDGNEGEETASSGGRLTVQISDKVRVVRQDRYNVVIEKKSDDGAWKHTNGFHGSFRDALLRLLDSSIPAESMTAKDLINAWNACAKRITDAVASSGLMKSEPVSVSEEAETDVVEVEAEETEDAEA